VDTIVFVPDGPLRSIPMSALHDGERHLIEGYALAVAPGLRLVDPKPLALDDARMLLAGVSQPVQDFQALPKVPEELRAVQELFNGESLLDAEFSPDSLETAIAVRRPTLLHVASHVVFTGQPETSFVLTHDSRLDLNQLASIIGRTRFRDDPLELLVLSACRTAVDDERAGLGLAGIAVRSGARSAVGSLWSLSDDAAFELVVDFYRHLRAPDTSRAQALRAAQLELMGDSAFSHPFYWSPMLLVSNWL